MKKKLRKMWLLAVLCVAFCAQNVFAEETPSADAIMEKVQKTMSEVKVIGVDASVIGSMKITAISDQNTGISTVTMTEGSEKTITWVDQNAKKSYTYNDETGKYEFEPTDEKESEAKDKVDESMTTVQKLKYTYDGKLEKEGKTYYILKGTYTQDDVTYDYVLYVDSESYRLKSLTMTISGMMPLSITATSEFTYPEKLELPAEVSENAILANGYNVSGKDYKHVVYAVKHVKDKAVFYVESTTQNKGKVTILDTITVCGEQYPVYGISDEAFVGKKQITSLVIGKNVEEIGKQAFSGCKKLKNVTIKSSVIRKIGSKAFYNNAKNLKIKVPKKKLSQYKKLLKKAKLSKTAKVTK